MITDAFIVGAPRSGTTWLQGLTVHSSRVVAPRETGIFSGTLSVWERTWEWHVRTSTSGIGLPGIMSRDDFESFMRESYQSLRREIARARPGASLVVEKTPAHALHMKLIRWVVPGARFVHIVRDPRDAVASTLGAGESWAREFVALGSWPGSVEAAVTRWRDYTGGALRDTSDDDTLLVTYEDLARDPATTLGQVWDFLDLGDGIENAMRAIADLPRHLTDSLPQDFSFHSRSAAPRRLSRFERWFVETRCAKLMAELGYANTHRVLRPVRMTMEGRVHMRTAARRLRRIRGARL